MDEHSRPNSRASNLQRSEWRQKCREVLADHLSQSNLYVIAAYNKLKLRRMYIGLRSGACSTPVTARFIRRLYVEGTARKEAFVHKTTEQAFNRSIYGIIL